MTVVAGHCALELGQFGSKLLTSGVPLISTVVSSRSRVTVTMPGFVSPVLQMTHFMAATSSFS
jgi:hypothetical protein